MVFASLLLLAPLAGCTPETAEPVSQEPITIILGAAGPDLNPYTNTVSTRQVGELLFRGVLGVDDAGAPVPDVALDVPTVANGGLSQDRTQVTYRLDPDAVWADGHPLDAEDVVFTWGLIESGILEDDPGEEWGVVERVEAVDAHTVSLGLSEPHTPLAWRFIPYILPAHLLEGSPDLLSDDFWFHPVGSRGRSVTENLPSVQTRLADPDGELSPITVVFTDSDDEAGTVWSSSIACAWIDPPVGPAGAEQFDSVPGNVWRAFVMNLEEGEPTADLAMRQALSLAASVTVAPGDAGPYGAAISEHAFDRESVSRALEGEPFSLDIYANPKNAAEGDRIEDIDLPAFGGKPELFPTFDHTGYHGGGPLALGWFDVALIEFPIGIPYGWDWPYRAGDAPTQQNPVGLNISRTDDAALSAHHEAMRSAGEIEEYDAALLAAWERLEELSVIHWDERLDRAVLYKGLDGVRAVPFESLAIVEAGSWTLASGDGGDQ